MKGFFEKDSFLKVISFVIAVLLWFYIIAVVDPSVDITRRDIPVRFTNVKLLEEQGLCLINEDEVTVELKIRGSRQKIANIEAKNIYATADLSNITKTGRATIPIAISIPYEYDEIVSKKPHNAEVYIDKIVTATKDVKVITTGSVSNGYIAGEAVPEVKKVTLKGAKTMIDRIGSVGAEIDFDDRTAAINDSAELFFMDISGKRMNKSNIVYSLVETDIKKVQISCPVYKLKTVPVIIDASVEGYKVSVQPSNITVYAENEVLENITEIRTERINLNLIAEEQTGIKLIFPAGVASRDGISEVSVKAEKKD